MNGENGTLYKSALRKADCTQWATSPLLSFAGSLCLVELVRFGWWFSRFDCTSTMRLFSAVRFLVAVAVVLCVLCFCSVFQPFCFIFRLFLVIIFLLFCERRKVCRTLQLLLDFWWPSIGRVFKIRVCEASSACEPAFG